MTASLQVGTGFDFIVVGAGTAGCIVAARLAERGQRVLLLEAGGPYRRVLDVPLVGLWAWLRRPDDYCWNQSTVPQSALGGRRVWFPGGRLTGGSSAINAMIYTRGHPASYDRWGVPGWRFDDLLPYHRRAEAFEDGASMYHGDSGPLAISRSRYDGLGHAFIRGAAEAGFEPTHDFNGPRSDGAGFYALTQRRGVRVLPGKSYLALARRSRGFHHMTGAFVTRLLRDGARVTGVVVSDRNGEQRFTAGRVVVSAGAVRTPQLLMVSGIGPAPLLRKHRIDVAVDHPGVGAGLQDQVRVPVAFRLGGASPTRPDRLVVAGLRYVLDRSGLLASNVCDAAVVTSLSSGTVPDVRVALRWRVFPESGVPLVDLEVATLQPVSRGHVAIRSSDPGSEPAIDPGYLSAAADRDVLAGGIELARRLAGTSAMRAAGIGAEFAPAGIAVDTHIRAHAASAYHPIGSCRMGTDDASVVDPRLSVRGVDGLSIVDASVIPSCVAANAQASVIAVAEKASDLLVE